MTTIDNHRDIWGSHPPLKLERKMSDALLTDEQMADLREMAATVARQLMGGTKLHTYTLAKEGGATMRGAGLKEPTAEVAQQQWNREARPRDERDIYDEKKFRWTEELPEVKP